MGRNNSQRFRFRVRIRVGREFKTFFTLARSHQQAAKQVKQGRVLSVTKEPSKSGIDLANLAAELREGAL